MSKGASINKWQVYESEKRVLLERLHNGSISWDEYERLIRALCRKLKV